MSVLNYMEKQKNRIRTRHEGETFFFGGEVEGLRVETRSAYDILDELNALDGLNTCERLAANCCFVR